MERRRVEERRNKFKCTCRFGHLDAREGGEVDDFLALELNCILRSIASADAFNVGRYAEHNGRLIHVTARSLVESQLCNAWLLVS